MKSFPGTAYMYDVSNNNIRNVQMVVCNKFYTNNVIAWISVKLVPWMGSWTRLIKNKRKCETLRLNSVDSH